METPSNSHIKTLNFSPSPILSGSPSTPNSPYEYVLTREKAIERVIELENELNEFQSSSKELEAALEEELDIVEKEKNQLNQKLREKDDKLKQSQNKILDLQREINNISTKNQEIFSNYKKELSDNKKRLIEIEILNDNFEQNERVIRSKLNSMEDNYNDLLEKNALLESEVSYKNDLLTQEKLSNTNNNITINNLTRKVKLLEDHLLKERSKHKKTSPFEDYTIDTGDGVDEYAYPVPSLSMTKSSSMQKLHELIDRSENMNSKVQDLKSSLTKKGSKRSMFKSPSTIQLSKSSSLTPSYSNKENKKSPKSLPAKSKRQSLSSNTRIPLSPSSVDVTSLQKTRTAKLISSELRPIEGSPNEDKVIDRSPAKRTNLLATFRKISLDISKK